MATREQIGPYLVIPNAQASPASTGSMATSITSAPTIVRGVSQISYQVVWSAGSTPIGAISLQGSNDYSIDAMGNVKNAGTWTTLTFNYNGTPVSSVPVTGNSGSGMIDIGSTGMYAMRIVYTRTSGSGTLAVTLNAKVA